MGRRAGGYDPRVTRGGPTIEEHEDWRELAACRTEDAELFFPPSDEAVEQIERAREICRPCLVRPDCLAYALETRQSYGIWAGTTPDQRRRIRRRLLEEPAA